MSNYVLVQVAPPPPPVVPVEHFPWKLFLSSMDGATTIPLTDRTGQVLLQSGFLGLGVPPVNVVVGSVPGIEGGLVEDVQILARNPVLPVKVVGRDEAHKMQAIQQLRDLTDPSVSMTSDGNFKIVSLTPAGTRELTVAYRGGLEGDNHGQVRPELFVLELTAVDPYARDRDAVTRTFSLGQGDPFLAAASSTDSLWPRSLAPSTVIGDGMAVDMASAVPVYASVALRGPCDSALIESDSGLRLEVPAALTAAQTLQIVTDPRARSIRLNGAQAAGRLALGSRMVPFRRGANTLSVTAPGATSQTQLTLSWRGGHRSMW
jgi:hypothetical protein